MRLPLASVFIVTIFIIAGLIVLIPNHVQAGWVENNRLETVQFYDNTSLIQTFSSDGQTVTYTDNKEVSQIRITYVAGPNFILGSGINIYVDNPNEAPTELGEITTYDEPVWANQTHTHLMIDGLEYLRITAFFNLTSIYIFNYAGNYLFTVHLGIWIPGPVDIDTWELSVYRFDDSQAIGETTFGIGTQIVIVIWVLMVFLPGLILNGLVPKIGFIGGTAIMSTALTLTASMPLWVFMVILIGIVVLVFRGE